MIEDYLKTYRLGSHCTSTSLMNISSYYGLKLSEDMCFGLGMGLGFSFYKIEEMEKFCFSGRNRNLESNFFSQLGIDAEHRFCIENEEMWEHLSILVNKKKCPVLVKLDISSLQYLMDYFKFTERMELSEHMAVVIGIEKDEIILSEYFTKQPIRISKEEFFRSTNYKFEKKSLYNDYYVIQFNNTRRQLSRSIRQAIEINVHQMQYGFGSNLGLPGIKKFQHDILYFGDYMDFQQLRKNLLFAYVSFEKIGTGGGNFRRMYARFLREAAKYLELESLNEAAGLYSELAIKWKEFSNRLFECSQLEEEWKAKQSLLKENIDLIYQLEHDAIMKLKDCIAAKK